MTKAYLSEVCASFFGPFWLTTQWISVAFIRPVIARDTVTTSAMVKRCGEQSGKTTLELDLWCKNQRGNW